jgi:hypothetical protein
MVEEGKKAAMEPIWKTALGRILINLLGRVCLDANLKPIFLSSWKNHHDLKVTTKHGNTFPDGCLIVGAHPRVRPQGGHMGPPLQLAESKLGIFI